MAKEPFVKDFGGLPEFLHYVQNQPRVGDECFSQTPGNEQFFGTTSMAHAIRLATNGWPEGAKAIREMFEVLAPALQGAVATPEVFADVIGEFCDVGEFVSGVPECCRSYRESENRDAGQQIIHIVLNLAVSGGVDIETVFARGAAAGVLAEALELSGRVVEMTVTAGCNTEAIFSVRVKRAGEPIQLDQLAFCLANPSMQRRLFFRAYETAPKANRRMGTYGAPPEYNPNGDIYLGAANIFDVQWQDVESAKAWIIAHLREQGVQLTEKAA